MRAWWCLLIMVHLVCGNQDQFENLYENSVKTSFGEDSFGRKEDHLDTSYNPEAVYTKKKRRNLEEDREKKHQQFHAWGGKRYGDEDEDEESNEYEENNQKNLNNFSPFTSLTNSSQEDFSKESFTKRSKQIPAFSSWGGKRDPEVLNDLGKRGDVYSYLPEHDIIASGKSEQSIKRYPSFNSWAGKRAAAFNSWGGKRGAAFNSWGGKRAAEFDSLGGTGENAFVTDNPNEFESMIDYSSPKIFSNKYLTTYAFKLDNIHESTKDRPTPEDVTESLNPEKAAAFKNWIGKRSKAAFNSWGGKRAAAFNSWGGKRAAAFNSWGGKRAAAFNSWGGKRAAAFNSWGGKRAAAFNSWGGKRAAAFNSWGGKRAAAFNSWGGKRAAAFNSWGGKRVIDQQDPKTNLKLLKYNYLISLLNFHHNKHYNDIQQSGNLNGLSQQKELKHESDVFPKSYQLENTEKDDSSKYDKISSHFVQRKNSYEGEENYGKEKLQENSEKFNWDVMDKVYVENELEKVKKPLPLLVYRQTNKRNPLFSSWYGNKVPTVLLTNGKRRPAFSSWGGKRSEQNTIFQTISRDCIPTNTIYKDRECSTQSEPNLGEFDRNFGKNELEEKINKRKKREVNCNTDKKEATTGFEEKKSGSNEKKNRIYTRMLLQGSLSWPMAFRAFPKNMDFYAWGGKRSL